MKMDSKLACAVLAGLAFSSVQVVGGAIGEAAYYADTDTEASVLNYIENERRAERENRPTKEQAELLEDTSEMAKAYPADILQTLPEGATIPTSFEGEDISYDQATGEFYARGNVRVTQLVNRRFAAEEVRGNTKTQDVYVDENALLLQLSPSTPKVHLLGYKLHYNYGEKTGTLADANGKIGNQFVTGKRFEVYPDRIIAYEGTITKSSAKTPEYHISAQKMEIYPNDKMILTDCDFWLGKVLIAHHDRYVADIRPSADQGSSFPRLRYSSEDGVTVSMQHNVPIAENVDFVPRLKIVSDVGIRSNAELRWFNGRSDYRILYGYYEDADDHWMKRKGSFQYKYSHPIAGTPLTYSLDFEHGRWVQRNIHSTHTFGKIGLSHAPIKWHGGYTLLLSTDYSITKESYDESKLKGFGWSATLLKKFDDRFTVFSKYSYVQNSTQDSLFNYNNEDYRRSLYAGLSYQFTPIDRLVFSTAYDLDARSLRDIDYYWYHDIHSIQFITRYRAKRDEWKVRVDFAPW